MNQNLEHMTFCIPRLRAKGGLWDIAVQLRLDSGERRLCLFRDCCFLTGPKGDILNKTNPETRSTEHKESLWEEMLP